VNVLAIRCSAVTDRVPSTGRRTAALCTSETRSLAGATRPAAKSCKSVLASKAGRSGSTSLPKERGYFVFCLMQLVLYADWSLVPVNPLTGPACMKPEPTFPSTPPQKQFSPQCVWESRVDMRPIELQLHSLCSPSQPPVRATDPNRARCSMLDARFFVFLDQNEPRMTLGSGLISEFSVLWSCVLTYFMSILAG
jgi:hypothetical protein